MPLWEWWIAHEGLLREVNKCRAKARGGESHAALGPSGLTHIPRVLQLYRLWLALR